MRSLVRQLAPDLSALYPPNPMPDAAVLTRAVLRALHEHPSLVLEFLRSPPQTNDRPCAGGTRVLFHSVVWSYLSEDSRNRISAHMNRAGAAAAGDAPLAWLRFELADPPELRLTLWPAGEETVLAHAHPHGAWVRWHA